MAEENIQEDNSITKLESFTRILTTLVEAFGWPGTTIVFGYFFVVQYATADQKQRLIERYLLGTGIGQAWPLIVLSIVFVVVTVAQYRWYQRNIATLDKELTRVAEEKSRLQEALAGRKLQHGDKTKK